MYISDYYKKNIFNYNHLLMGYDNYPIGSPNTFDEDINSENKYIGNKYGFRSKEFKKNDNIDILFSGCSISFGMGIPEDAIWGSLISKDKSYVNLSIPGVGAEYNIKQIYKYINLYGKPKQIFCLFAGFTRLSEITDDLYFKHDRNNKKIGRPPGEPIEIIDLIKENQIQIKTLVRDGKVMTPQKILKTPINIEEIISPHQGIFRNVWSIYYFQQFCKFAGIDFIWSTWDKEFNDVLTECFEHADFILDKNKYIAVDWNLLDVKFKVFCDDFHQNEYYNSKYWNTGTDADRHPGVHWHKHIADMFMDRVKV